MRVRQHARTKCTASTARCTWRIHFVLAIPCKYICLAQGFEQQSSKEFKFSLLVGFDCLLQGLSPWCLGNRLFCVRKRCVNAKADAIKFTCSQPHQRKFLPVVESLGDSSSPRTVVESASPSFRYTLDSSPVCVGPGAAEEVEGAFRRLQLARRGASILVYAGCFSARLAHLPWLPFDSALEV